MYLDQDEDRTRCTRRELWTVSKQHPREHWYTWCGRRHFSRCPRVPAGCCYFQQYVLAVSLPTRRKLRYCKRIHQEDSWRQPRYQRRNQYHLDCGGCADNVGTGLYFGYWLDSRASHAADRYVYVLIVKFFNILSACSIQRNIMSCQINCKSVCHLFQKTLRFVWAKYTFMVRKLSWSTVGLRLSFAKDTWHMWGGMQSLFRKQTKFTHLPTTLCILRKKINIRNRNRNRIVSSACQRVKRPSFQMNQQQKKKKKKSYFEEWLSISYAHIFRSCNSSGVSIWCDASHSVLDG